MYKLSVYNYFVPYNDQVIYFNGLSGMLFCVSKKEDDFISEQMKDLISFQIQYPSFFSKLKDWNFVVEENVNEVDVIRLKNRLQVFDNKSYNVMINPTQECNFSCWYCDQRLPKGNYMSDEIFIKIKKHFECVLENENIKYLHIGWFGGEPLLYFDKIIYPLASYVKRISNEHKIKFENSIVTNAYLLNEDLLDRIKEIGLRRFQITIDGDEKRHNKIRNSNGLPSFKKIMNNIYNLCESMPDCDITLRLNYDNQTLFISDVEKVFNDIPEKYRKNIRPNFQRVWQTKSSDATKVEDEVKRLYRVCQSAGYSIGKNFSTFNINNSIRCYVDKYNFALINYDGGVYKCTSKGYTEDNRSGYLSESGELIWDNEKVINRYVKATFDNEMCINCKHLPICCGPCSQALINNSTENLKNVCVLNTSDFLPETFIKILWEEKLNKSKQN